MVLSGTSSSQEDKSLAGFEELAMPLFDSLYNFARWLTQSREEAEDLVQETYVKALKGFTSFQQGTNFRAWMYRILRNTFLTSRTGLAATRTVALETEDEGHVVAVSRETPESILLSHVDQQQMRAALDQLPDMFREMLLLCDVEEMSYQEIADTLSIPIGTVMSRLHRARKALRAALEERPQERSAPEDTWHPKLGLYLDYALSAETSKPLILPAILGKQRNSSKKGVRSCFNIC
jgi:RNA polymerase sigma-70 factor (ECF subfamily)